MKYIRNRKSLLILENINNANKAVESYKKELLKDDLGGFIDDIDEMYNIVKNDLKKNPNLIYTFINFLIQWGADAIDDLESRRNVDNYQIVFENEYDTPFKYINWMKNNKGTVKNLPKPLIKYTNFEELVDDTTDTITIAKSKEFFNLLKYIGYKFNPKDYKDIAVAYTELDDNIKKEISKTAKHYKINNEPIEKFIQTISNTINSGSDKSEILNKLNSIGGLYTIIYDDNETLLIRTKDKEIIQTLGSPRWCIVYSDNYYEQYCSVTNRNTQYLLFNFKVASDNLNSLFGITLNKDGEPLSGASQDKGNNPHPLSNISEITKVPLDVFLDNSYTNESNDMLENVESFEDITEIFNAVDKKQDLVYPFTLDLLEQGKPVHFNTYLKYMEYCFANNLNNIFKGLYNYLKGFNLTWFSLQPVSYDEVIEMLLAYNKEFMMKILPGANALHIFINSSMSNLILEDLNMRDDYIIDFILKSFGFENKTNNKANIEDPKELLEYYPNIYNIINNNLSSGHYNSFITMLVSDLLKTVSIEELFYDGSIYNNISNFTDVAVNIGSEKTIEILKTIKDENTLTSFISNLSESTKDVNNIKTSIIHDYYKYITNKTWTEILNSDLFEYYDNVAKYIRSGLPQSLFTNYIQEILKLSDTWNILINQLNDLHNNEDYIEEVYNRGQYDNVVKTIKNSVNDFVIRKEHNLPFEFFKELSKISILDSELKDIIPEFLYHNDIMLMHIDTWIKTYNFVNEFDNEIIAYFLWNYANNAENQEKCKMFINEQSENESFDVEEVIKYNFNHCYDCSNTEDAISLLVEIIGVDKIDDTNYNLYLMSKNLDYNKYAFPENYNIKELSEYSDLNDYYDNYSFDDDRFMDRNTEYLNWSDGFDHLSDYDMYMILDHLGILNEVTKGDNKYYEMYNTSDSETKKKLNQEYNELNNKIRSIVYYIINEDYSDIPELEYLEEDKEYEISSIKDDILNAMSDAENSSIEAEMFNDAIDELPSFMDLDREKMIIYIDLQDLVSELDFSEIERYSDNADIDDLINIYFDMKGKLSVSGNYYGSYDDTSTYFEIT